MSSHDGIHFVEMGEEEFVNECVDLVSKAQEKGIILRILGAMAVYLHTKDNPRMREIHKVRFGAEGAPMFTDLDLMAYSKQSKQIKKFFEEMGFLPDKMINALFSSKRLIYYHPEGKYHIDVFFDKLEFSHDVPFGKKPGEGRLELSFPAISPTDVVLEKLQIHDINRKDLVDLIVLFLSHEFSDKEGKGLINVKYIAKLLADDWGFWYDAKNNLEKVKAVADVLKKEGVLKDEEVDLVKKKVDELIKALDEEPKTKKWQKRAKKGTKSKWYRDVEEVVR